MILYIEQDILENPRTQIFLDKYPRAERVIIRNYKNIFDKKIPYPIDDCIILAAIHGNHVTECPPWYDLYNHSFFFKTSIGCLFDCDYCYLKGAFENHAMKVFFLNYEEIQDSIRTTIQSVREKDPHGSIIFYASDYSDIQWFDILSGFNESFIPFFEQFEGVICESRTKSANIATLRSFKDTPKNFEVAFSLNPEAIIAQFEHKSASLSLRIEAINILLDAGWKVWLRFLPLLPVPGYESMYRDFLEHVATSVDFSRVHSFSVGSLLYTKADYRVMQKKVPGFSLLYQIEQDTEDGFLRFPLPVRTYFYKLFREFLPKEKTSICLDV